MRVSVLAAAAVLVLSSERSAAAGNCPSAVTAAALEAHAGATVASCKKGQEKGKTQYEVKLTTYHDRTVELSAVPQAVMTAFNAKYAGAKPSRAEKQTTPDGRVTYELAFASGKKKQEATFTAEGSFVEEV